MIQSNGLGFLNGLGQKGKKDTMKNKVFEAMRTLQLFAEGEGAGAGGSGNGGGTGGDGGAGSGGEGGNELLSFDDFLKQEGNQAEFDRRVQKAIDTAVSNAQRKWKDIHDDKLSEAEKLAKMTNEEKAAYRMSQMEKELNAFKEKDALAEMSKTARKMLSEEDINIPDELLSHLVSTDAEDTKNTVQAFTKLFKENVQDAVKDKLKGNPPKRGTGGKGTVTREQILAIKNPSERQRMIAEHINLFE
ncbi:MAG TPA: DUF4355 domain-containing protein [Candidatus Anaerostipes avistercoris]|uniref:DUF4355 domain-containing protein n=1 Tax=Candidatus Anaerostipes avistercoris TaxID=2838462 RepID=A0A9D2T6R9_9FIRM|nr:DUF4355 domain-containing protein [Candidatus Anaerostipes avistercoris]